MSFNLRPQDINDFDPDALFDQDENMIAVEFDGGQVAYVNYFDGTWGVSVDDPTMSWSMVERLGQIRREVPRTPGVRLDSAVVGQVALFSAAGYDWQGIFRSERPVSSLEPLRRADVDISTVVLVENRRQG